MTFGGGKKTAGGSSGLGGGRGGGSAFGGGFKANFKAGPAAGAAKVAPANATAAVAAVASVFGGESSDDEEEMPAEAKARMRNVGKFTLTSAGPNSYSKGKGGFIDPKAKKWADDMSAKNGPMQRKPPAQHED